MKFQCDRCKTRYSIADEKVRGKVLKIRCKNCSSIITVREGGPTEVKSSRDDVAPVKGTSHATGTPAVAPVAKATYSPSPRPAPSPSPVLARAFEKAMVTVPPPLPENEGATEDDDLLGEKTSVAEGPLPFLMDEWYLSVDGSQDGPFSVVQAQQRVAEMPFGEEMYAWRDGFDDWLPVDRVQELAQYVPQAAPRRVGAPPMGDARMPMAARATPMAASPAGTGGVKKTIAGMGPEPRGRSAVEDKNTPIPLSELASAAAGLSHGADENGQQRRGAGEYDLFVGEASQMVQISQIPGMPKAGITPVPIVRSTPINGSGAAIGRGTSPGPATPLPMPPATATSTGAARLIAPPKKKKSYLGVILVCCFAAAAILGVILFLGFRQRAGVNEDDVAGDPSGAGGSEVIDNFYKGGGGLPGTSAPAGTPAAPGAEAAAAPDKSPVRRPGIRATNPTQAPRPLGGGGKPDLFSDDDDPQQVTVDDILEKGKIANPGMKQCYNRALKNDPMLKLTRMDLRITVGTSGLVTEVKPLTNATKSQILTSCLVGIVKGWRFRKSREGLTADLPIIFSNG